MKHFPATSAFGHFLTAMLLLTLTQNLAAQPICTLACNDQVTVDVPAGGSVEFLPEMIGVGNLLQFCPNGIFQTQAQINGSWQNASGNFVFDGSHVGKTYVCRLRELNTGNACWGNVQVNGATSLKETATLHIALSPSPAQDLIRVNASRLEASEYRFQLNNAAGRVVFSRAFATPIFEVDCSSLPTGIYFYTLSLSDGRADTGKVAVQR